MSPAYLGETHSLGSLQENLEKLAGVDAEKHGKRRTTVFVRIFADEQHIIMLRSEP